MRKEVAGFETVAPLVLDELTVAKLVLGTTAAFGGDGVVEELDDVTDEVSCGVGEEGTVQEEEVDGAVVEFELRCEKK